MNPPVQAISVRIVSKNEPLFKSPGLEKFLAREGLGLRLELFGVDEAERSSMPRGLCFTTIVGC
jgi:hypothetical protein